MYQQREIIILVWYKIQFYYELSPIYCQILFFNSERRKWRRLHKQRYRHFKSIRFVVVCQADCRWNGKTLNKWERYTIVESYKLLFNRTFINVLKNFLHKTIFNPNYRSQ